MILADILDVFKDNSLVAVTYLIAFGLGWYVSFLKSRAEIAKLTAESIKLTGEHLKSVQAARDAYDLASSECTKHVLAVISSLNNAEEEKFLRDRREAFCSALADVAISKYLAHIEWEHLDNKSTPEHISLLIDEELLKELERFCYWVSVINSPEFVDKMKLSPLIISKRKLRRFRKLAKDVPSDDRRVYYAKIDEVIGKLAKG